MPLGMEGGATGSVLARFLGKATTPAPNGLFAGEKAPLPGENDPLPPGLAGKKGLLPPGLGEKGPLPPGVAGEKGPLPPGTAGEKGLFPPEAVGGVWRDLSGGKLRAPGPGLGKSDVGRVGC